MFSGLYYRVVLSFLSLSSLIFLHFLACNFTLDFSVFLFLTCSLLFSFFPFSPVFSRVHTHSPLSLPCIRFSHSFLSFPPFFSFFYIFPLNFSIFFSFILFFVSFLYTFTLFLLFFIIFYFIFLLFLSFFIFFFCFFLFFPSFSILFHFLFYYFLLLYDSFFFFCFLLLYCILPFFCFLLLSFSFFFIFFYSTFLSSI